MTKREERYHRRKRRKRLFNRSKRQGLLTITVTPVLGEYPGYGSEWWEKKDWDDYHRYVDRLKAEGKYMTKGDPVTLTFKELPAFNGGDKMFSNFGFFMPKGIEVDRFGAIIEADPTKDITTFKYDANKSKGGANNPYPKSGEDSKGEIEGVE